MATRDLPAPERSLQAIAGAAVLGIAFTLSEQTLLLDFRPDTGRVARVVVETYADSSRTLLPLLNAHFGPPGTIPQFTYMPWRQAAEAFVAAGLRDAVVSRLADVGMRDAETVVDNAWRALADPPAGE